MKQNKNQFFGGFCISQTLHTWSCSLPSKYGVIIPIIQMKKQIERLSYWLKSHISCGVADLWYLIKSLSFQTYCFPLEKLFSKCGSRTTADQDPFKGSMRTCAYFSSEYLYVAKLPSYYFNQNQMSYQSECKSRVNA